jgi:hypothetical protein
MTVGAALVLLLVVTMWALNELTDDRPDPTAFSGGRFSLQSPSDHLLLVPVLNTGEPPLGQP